MFNFIDRFRWKNNWDRQIPAWNKQISGFLSWVTKNFSWRALALLGVVGFSWLMLPWKATAQEVVWALNSPWLNTSDLEHTQNIKSKILSSGIDITWLERVFTWDLSFFENSPEVIELRKKISEYNKLLREVKDKDTIKTVSEEIVAFWEDINTTKKRLAWEYLDKLEWQINKLYPTDADKVRLLTEIWKIEDEDLLTFTTLVRSLMINQNSFDYKSLRSFSSWVYSNVEWIVSDQEEAISKVLDEVWIDFERLRKKDAIKLFSEWWDVFFQAFLRLREWYESQKKDIPVYEEEKIIALNSDYMSKFHDITKTYWVETRLDARQIELFYQALLNYRLSEQAQAVVSSVWRDVKDRNYKDVKNSQILLSDVNEWNVFEYLSDLNSDWQINEDDEGALFGSQILSLLKNLERTLPRSTFYANLSQIFNFWWSNVRLENRTQLVEFLKGDEKAKLNFWLWISYVVTQKLDLWQVMMLWFSQALSEDQKTKEDLLNDPKIWALYKYLMENSVKEWKDAIEKELKDGKITDEQAKIAMEELRNRVTEKSFLDEVGAQVIPLLKQWLDIALTTKSGTSVNFNVNSNAINLDSNESKRLITDNVRPTISIVQWWPAWVSIILWFQYSFGVKTWEYSQIVLWLWFASWIWTIKPSASVAYKENLDWEEINWAWLEWFNPHDNTISVWGQVWHMSWVNLWLETNPDKNLEKKAKQFSAILKSLYKLPDWVLYKWLDDIFSYIQNNNLSQDQMSKDKVYWKMVNDELMSYLKKLLEKSKARLSQIEWFDHLDPETKVRLILSESDFVLKSFVDLNWNLLQDKWWDLLAWWLTAWIWPIPISPSFSVWKVYFEHTENNTSWIMMKSLVDEWKLAQVELSPLSMSEILANWYWINSTITPTWSFKINIKSFSELKENWVEISIDPGLLKQIWFDDEWLSIWNLPVLVQEMTTKDWKKLAITIWNSKWNVILNDWIRQIFEWNGTLWQPSITYWAVSISNLSKLQSTSFWL